MTIRQYFSDINSDVQKDTLVSLFLTFEITITPA